MLKTEHEIAAEGKCVNETKSVDGREILGERKKKNQDGDEEKFGQKSRASMSETSQMKKMSETECYDAVNR